MNDHSPLAPSRLGPSGPFPGRQTHLTNYYGVYSIHPLDKANKGSNIRLRHGPRLDRLLSRRSLLPPSMTIIVRVGEQTECPFTHQLSNCADMSSAPTAVPHSACHDARVFPSLTPWSASGHSRPTQRFQALPGRLWIDNASFNKVDIYPLDVVKPFVAFAFQRSCDHDATIRCRAGACRARFRIWIPVASSTLMR